MKIKKNTCSRSEKMQMTYVSMPTFSVRSCVLVTEAMVENKEHLLQVRENEDDLGMFPRPHFQWVRVGGARQAFVSSVLKLPLLHPQKQL